MRCSERRTAVRSTFEDDFHTSTPSDARSRPPSLILVSLGLVVADVQLLLRTLCYASSAHVGGRHDHGTGVALDRAFRHGPVQGRGCRIGARRCIELCLPRDSPFATERSLVASYTSATGCLPYAPHLPLYPCNYDWTISARRIAIGGSAKA
jgi:hypothetical protein